MNFTCIDYNAEIYRCDDCNLEFGVIGLYNHNCPSKPTNSVNNTIPFNAKISMFNAKRHFFPCSRDGYYRCDNCQDVMCQAALADHNCPLVSPNSVNNMTIFHEAWKAAQALSDIAPELRGQSRSLYDAWDTAVAQNPALATEGIDEATMQIAAARIAREARLRPNSSPDPKLPIDLSALRDAYPRPLLATPRAGGADIGQQEKKESSPFAKIKLLAQEFAHEDQIGIGYYLFREGQDAPTYGHALRFYNGDPEQIVTALRALASHIEAKFKE